MLIKPKDLLNTYLHGYSIPFPFMDFFHDIKGSSLFVNYSDPSPHDRAGWTQGKMKSGKNWFESTTTWICKYLDLSKEILNY